MLSPAFQDQRPQTVLAVGQVGLGAWRSADLECLVLNYFSSSGLAYKEVTASQAKLSWQKHSEYSFINNKLQHFKNISLGGFLYAVSSAACWRSGVDFGAGEVSFKKAKGR